MSTDADVLSVEVHRAGMRDRVTRAEAEVSVAQAALNEAMGVPLDERYRLTTPLAEIREVLSFEARTRAEVEQRELARLSAGEKLAAAKAARLPQIGVRSAFEADRGRFVNQGGGNWLVAGTLRWNLFNGFADRARVQEAGDQQRVADAEKRRAEQSVRLEVIQAESAFREAMSRMESADAIIRSADESLRITRNRYDSGLATATDLLRTENALVEARLRRLSAIYDQRLAAIAWALATGNLNGDANVLE
jgi:outer membrane protein TolC